MTPPVSSNSVILPQSNRIVLCRRFDSRIFRKILSSVLKSIVASSIFQTFDSLNVLIDTTVEVCVSSGLKLPLALTVYQ